MTEVDGTDVPRGSRRSEVRPARPPLPGPPFGFVPAVWGAAWISLFTLGDWQVAFPMMLLSAPVAVLSGRWRRASRRRAKAYKRSTPEARMPKPTAAPMPEPVSLPAAPSVERSVAGALVKAQTSRGRLDPDAVALVEELADLLRPLLAHVRERGADPAVRHDIEAIAGEHLPAVLDAYLALPPSTLHERTALGDSPADVLRSQLLLLLEGCRQLGDAVQHADLAHQQELSRFLDAKFRRSDLDL